MSLFGNMSRKMSQGGNEGDGQATNQAATIAVNTKPEDSSKYVPLLVTQPAAKVVEEETRAALDFKRAGEDISKTIWACLEWLGYIILAGLVGLAMVLAWQYTLANQIYDNDFLNRVAVVSMILGLGAGPFIIGFIFKGLQLGTFQGVAKTMACGLIIFVFFDEVGALYARYNDGFALIYFKYISPFALPIIAVWTKGLRLMRQDERRRRQIVTMRDRERHETTRSEIEGRRQKTKDESSARKMGLVTRVAARKKAAFFAFIHTAFFGWVEAWRQGAKMAENAAKETGGNIEGYRRPRRKKTTATKK